MVKINRRSTKSQRRVERKKIGSLHDRIIVPRTLNRYQKAVTAFFVYSHVYTASAPTSCSLDLDLCSWIEHLWQEGDPKAWAQDARSGLMHFISNLRNQLHGSQRLLKAWSKHELPVRAPPLPLQFLLGLVGCAITCSDLRLAVLLLVAFHCFLRAG